MIRLLYLDRVDVLEASRSLGMTEAELRARHRTALELIKEKVLVGEDRA